MCYAIDTSEVYITWHLEILAGIYSQTERYEEAETLLWEIVHILEQEPLKGCLEDIFIKLTALFCETKEWGKIVPLWVKSFPGDEFYSEYEHELHPEEYEFYQNQNIRAGIRIYHAKNRFITDAETSLHIDSIVLSLFEKEHHRNKKEFAAMEEILCSMAKTYTSLGQYDEAIKSLEKAGHSAFYLGQIADVYQAAKQYDKAISIHQMIMNMDASYCFSSRDKIVAIEKQKMKEFN